MQRESSGRAERGPDRGVPDARDRPLLLLGSGIAAIGGAVILALSILVAPFFVPDYNWIADTISDLGAGQHEWIVDVGLYAYAGGLLALGAGAAHAHLGRHGWSYGIFALLLIAGTVIIVGARNEYGDSDSEGVVIHVYLVYALGLLFATAPFAMAGGAARSSPGFAWTMRGFGIAWCLAAPIFFFLPNGIDGAYERALGAIALGWSSTLAVLLLRRAVALPGWG